MLLMFLPGYSRLQELRQKNTQLQDRIAAVEKENEGLRVEKERLQEDKVYLEKVAREKMGLIREGEVIYHMVPEGKE